MQQTTIPLFAAYPINHLSRYIDYSIPHEPNSPTNSMKKLEAHGQRVTGHTIRTLLKYE